MWRKEWMEMKVANHAKGFYTGPNPGKAKYVCKLARLELGRLVRIITGHNNLNFFQHKLGLYNNPKCRFCGTGDETVKHFITSCPRLLTHQREIFGDAVPTDDMKWSVRDLLNFSYHPGINEAYEGTWNSGDPLPQMHDLMDESMGLGWLDDEDDPEDT